MSAAAEIIDVRPLNVAKSDQLNALDLVGGPIDVKIIGAQLTGKPDQPLTLHISGDRQPWKPCKTTRRIMEEAWGYDAAAWVGKSVRLFCDKSVRFGGDEVGGIRISGLSDIPSAVAEVTYRKSRKEVGKAKIVRIEPVNSGPRPALMACVKSFGATQMDLIDFMQEKSRDNVSPGPVDSWPDRKVSEVLARLQGSGGDVFKSWMAERLNRSAVPEWQDGGDADLNNSTFDPMPE